MPPVRDVVRLTPSRPTLEGAGVRLKRAVGFGDEYAFDPFLLLDDIHSKNPADYTAGFPWHPHRGIETVTYVLAGQVDHGDSMGTRGSIGTGDVQWMTAGGGIVHQEMPRPFDGDFRGLQLWVNLPRSEKMMAPRYRGITAGEIPVAPLPGGGELRVIAGRSRGIEGPVRGIVRAPFYLDVALPPGGVFEEPTEPGHTVFAYLLTGNGGIGSTAVEADHAALTGPGESFSAEAGERGMRFLLFGGAPLAEPIAWRGPIVMNTEAELDLAFRQYRDGTFLAHP